MRSNSETINIEINSDGYSITKCPHFNQLMAGGMACINHCPYYCGRNVPTKDLYCLAKNNATDEKNAVINDIPKEVLDYDVDRVLGNPFKHLFGTQPIIKESTIKIIHDEIHNEIYGNWDKLNEKI